MPLHVRLSLPTGTKTLKLPDRGNDRPVLFGRSAAAAVKVSAHTPQEDHCGLFVHDGQWYACDLYQSGQVVVNGQPADEPTAVQQGDVITIGPAGGPSIEVGAVVAPAAAPAAAPSPAGGPPQQHRPPVQHAAPPAQYAPQQPAYEAQAYEPQAEAYPPAYAPPAGEAAEPAAYTPSSYARKKKKASPLPVILGGVVALLVIGGGAAFLLTRGGDDKEKPGKTTAGMDKPGAGGDSGTASAPPTPAVDAPVGNDNAPGFPDPAAAVRAYVAALEAGGKSGIAKASVGLTNDRFAAIEPAMALSGSARQLENAAVRKFGEAGRGTVPPGVALTTESCAGARLTVAAAPPNAVATVAGFGPIPVRKTPTGWKVDLAAMYPDAKAAAAKADGASAAQGKLVQMLAKVMEDVANPKSATYGSAEQLKADVAAKLAELKIPVAAATRPTAGPVARTQPSVAVAPASPAAPAALVTPPPATRPAAAAPPRQPIQFNEGPVAMKIAFVCDAGGAVAKHLPVIRRELNTVIRSLSTKQSFVVVFAGPAGTPATTTGAELTPVTPASREAAAKFLTDYEPPAADQASDVAAAVEAAAALRPDLIYVLVGVDRADGPEVLKRVPQLSGGAKVNVIVMASSADEARAGAAAVDATRYAAMAAARRTGGLLTVVRPEELDK